MSEKKLTKEEAIDASIKFLEEVRLLEEKHGVSLNSDTGDIYLSYKNADYDVNYASSNKVWDSVKIGWEGDGTGLKVLEKKNDDIKKQALAKLTQEDSNKNVL